MYTYGKRLAPVTHTTRGARYIFAPSSPLHGLATFTHPTDISPMEQLMFRITPQPLRRLLAFFWLPLSLRPSFYGGIWTRILLHVGPRKRIDGRFISPFLLDAGSSCARSFSPGRIDLGRDNVIRWQTSPSGARAYGFVPVTW